jgi:hypothetical protein
LKIQKANIIQNVYLKFLLIQNAMNYVLIGSKL